MSERNKKAVFQETDEERLQRAKTLFAEELYLTVKRGAPEEEKQLVIPCTERQLEIMGLKEGDVFCVKMLDILTREGFKQKMGEWVAEKIAAHEAPTVFLKIKKPGEMKEEE